MTGGATYGYGSTQNLGATVDGSVEPPAVPPGGGAPSAPGGNAVRSNEATRIAEDNPRMKRGEREDMRISLPAGFPGLYFGKRAR